MEPLPLISKCVKGDNKAWEVFTKEYGPMAMNILRKFIDLDDFGKENVLQNVYIKLIKGGLANFRGTSRFEFLKYYKVIVVNEAQTYLKTENRWKNMAQDLISFPMEMGDQIEEGNLGLLNCKDENPGPDKITEGSEIIKVLQEILQQFPLKDQEVFIFKMKGYKDKEISDLLEVPMGTVASRNSRIVEKIKDELRKRGIEE
jgi:RNA polymerase sigma factor (sigma-70 family)